MKFFEVRTEFFRPMGRRIAVTAFCGVWTLIEVLSGALGWAAIFGAATVYLYWAFFMAFEQGPAGQDPEE